MSGSKYGKQKESLRADFEKFLAVRFVCPSSGATAPSMDTASPMDVLRFLHHRSKAGRTQVHKFVCPYFGKSGAFDCGCPVRFAAGTVDSYIGMLRALFNDLGRRFHNNPCDSSEVKNWLKACAKEQQQHRVPVKQATPIFSPQLRALVAEILQRIANLPPGSPYMPGRFILDRDCAFFLVQWYCGDRAGDLGNAKGAEVVRLEGGSLLFNHTVGKTIREADGQLLVVPRVEGDNMLCPVAAFDRYVGGCKAAGIDLRKGFLFPPTAPPRHDKLLQNAAFKSHAAAQRLKVYMPDAGLSSHGSRSGVAITLLMLGATKEAVMEHCRWATEQVCRHYTKLERVRRLDASAGLLRAGVPSVDGVSASDSAAALYEHLNAGYSQTPAL